MNQILETNTRILAIDYGDAYIGLAITDPTRTICRELDVWKNNRAHNQEQFLALFSEYAISQIILGYPISVHNSQENIQTAKVDIFREILSSWTNIPIILFDERYTSKMVHNAYKGLKNKPKRIDALSAQCILQSYLESSSY